MTNQPNQAPPMTTTDKVINNAAHHRFELTVNGFVSILTYERTHDTLVLVHTEVPPSLRGRGLGSRLVAAAVTFAVATGLAIEARCSFARSWLDRHPEVAAEVRVVQGQR
jgi:predicted GNAT family acetyltransferase